MKALVADRDTESWAQVSPWVASAAAERSKAAGWYPKYRTALILSDTLAVLVAVSSTFLFLFTPERHLSGFADVPYLFVSPVLVLAWVAVLGATESRAKSVIGAGLEEYKRVLTASLYVFGGMAVLSYWLQGGLSRALFVTTLPLGMVLLLGSRWMARNRLNRMRSRGRCLTPALVVGTGRAVLDVVRDIQKHTDAGFMVTGVCVVGDEKWVARELGQLRIRSMATLDREVRGTRYGAVVVADGLSREDSRDLAWRLENRPIELMFVPRVMDISGPRLKARSVEGLSLVEVELPRFTGWKLVAKRTFDMLFSAIALVLLAPVFLVVVVMIKLDDGGPVFFRQERVGRYGEPFIIHKFRTMCVDAEAKIDALIDASGGTALLFKLEDDPRITRIGSFLRKYSLDELPQFWSALWGGMSVVGSPGTELEFAL